MKKGGIRPSREKRVIDKSLLVVNVTSATAPLLLQRALPFLHIPPRLLVYFQSLNYLHHLLVPIRAKAYP